MVLGPTASVSPEKFFINADAQAPSQTDYQELWGLNPAVHLANTSGDSDVHLGVRTTRLK